MGKIKHTADEAKSIEAKLVRKGFSVEVSVDDEYFKLMLGTTPICADSANSDLYDTTLALATFNEILEQIDAPKRWIGVVSAAIARGYHPEHPQEVDQTLINAEKYIIDEVPFEYRSFEIVPDFWDNFNGRSATITWYDEDGECCLDSSQVIADDLNQRSYYRRLENGNLEAVDSVFRNDDNVHMYLDTVVTSRGEVVTLLA